MAEVTITHTIEDDIRSLLADKLDREEFLRRFTEHFVYIAVTPEYRDGNFGVLLVAVPDEEGMFLPVFTTEERFRVTPLANRYEALRVPFDEIMRQVRPDTGLLVNAESDVECMFRWFILQEYIEDFGVRHVKQEPTDDWLENVNADFSANEVPHGRRGWEAIGVWSDANGGLPINMSSPRAERIFAWFRENVNPVSNEVGPIATAALFFDTSFWPVTIPLAYGSPQINPLDLLRMPASVKLRFCADQNEMYIYLKFVADTFDYYYTIDDLRSTLPSKPFLAGFIGAGKEQITQSAALLLGRHPNSKSAEAARFALEMFLKAYLIVNANHDEAAIVKYSHRIKDLLAAVLKLEPESQLRFLENKLDMYPDVGARYRVDAIPPKDLWTMYYAAQTAGAIVLRPMSDRDSTRNMQVLY